MGESSTSATTVTLLRTKLHRPRVGDDLVPRARLLERLSQGLDLTPCVTLVSAPAGSGKTTLLCQWLDACDRPSAWLSLDENDNDLVVFLSYLIAAVQTLFDDACGQTQRLLRAPMQPPLDYLATTLINELAELSEAFVLCLDDCHAVQDDVIDQFLVALIDNLPANVHLALATRVDPRLDLARLMVNQQMIQIRMDDLRFTQDEVRAFLEIAIGTSLSDATLALLVERTEGWIGGLRLAALSMGSIENPEAFVRAFTGTHRDLTDYLINQVLSHQTKPVQDFLLRTSILDRFCWSLCDAILDEEPTAVDKRPVQVTDGEPSSFVIRRSSVSQGILEALERANMFLVPLDYERGWYRYHHLFQELLRHRLRVVLSEEEITSLHRRASTWYEREGYIEEALRHSLKAGDSLAASQLVEKQRHSLVNDDEFHTLERWLRLIPEEMVRTRPSLLVAQAEALHFKFDLPAAMPLLAEAERRLKEDETLPENEGLLLRAEMSALLSQGMYFSGDVEGALAASGRALQHLPSTYYFWRGLALDFYCVALQAKGKMETAVRMLNEAIYDIAGPVAYRFQAFIGLCFVYLSSGNLYQMRQTADSFQKFGVQNDHRSAVAWANYFAGLAHYEWNELQEAAARFSEVFVSRHRAQFITVHLSMLGLIKTYLGLGKLDASQEAIDNIGAYSVDTGNAHYLPEIDFLQWRHFILKDDIASASQISPSVPTGTPPTPLIFYEDVHLKQAQFRLAQGDQAELADTVAYLQQQLDEADQKHGTLRSIQILAQLALAYQKVGQANMALEYLEQSVMRGQAGGCIRTFVDLGPDMARLLRQLAERGVEPDYVRRIMAAFPETRATPEAVRPFGQDTQATKQAELVEPLTDRELEVLQLLGQRLSDQEIAQTLSISVYTAKTHARNIYQKLGVSGRKQAVAKAGSLGILS